MCIDPLTSPLSLLFIPDDTENIETLARVLSALYTAQSSSYDEDDTPHPYFNDESKLTYVSQVENRNLFRARLETDSLVEDVMVKFVKRYGQDVHAYLASLELAPKLHQVERLPGGWMAVIMSEFKGSNLLGMAEDKLVDAGYATFRTTLMEKLQAKDFVHGDLRRQNILLSDTNKFAVVDFDWAGKHGDVKYPLSINLNSTCGWSPDVDAGVLIDRSHDRYQLDKLLVS